MIVTALQSFNHGSIRANRGDQINILSTHAKALRDKGLVSFSGLPDDPPSQAGGEPSSASLPAQAAPTTTLTESGDGDSETKPKRKRKAKAEPEATEPATDGE
ncbi:MAG: hypothetical protein E6Q97_19895 [Desulfurellales bacterium]|nr:MAG: hypothetical protein E6Q97_19895 [Desulfurellales bacterium]